MQCKENERLGLKIGTSLYRCPGKQEEEVCSALWLAYLLHVSEYMQQVSISRHFLHLLLLHPLPLRYRNFSPVVQVWGQNFGADDCGDVEDEHAVAVLKLTLYDVVVAVADSSVN